MPVIEADGAYAIYTIKDHGAMMYPMGSSGAPPIPATYVVSDAVERDRVTLSQHDAVLMAASWLRQLAVPCLRRQARSASWKEVIDRRRNADSGSQQGKIASSAYPPERIDSSCRGLDALPQS